MAEHQRVYRKEELEEESRRKKKAQQPLYDQPKATDEGRFDFQVEPSVDRHAALLADVCSDEQQVSLVTQLQQSYGNAYVQRVMERIQAEKGSGQPLELKTRSEMETSFGHDFSEVHIHADTAADKPARELGARAFTSGKDIFFRENAYQPGSEAGKGLLGHELAHVIQQGSGISGTEHALSNSKSSLETEAETAGSAVASGKSITLSPAAHVSAIRLQQADAAGAEKPPPEAGKEPKEVPVKPPEWLVPEGREFVNGVVTGKINVRGRMVKLFGRPIAITRKGYPGIFNAKEQGVFIRKLAVARGERVWKEYSIWVFRFAPTEPSAPMYKGYKPLYEQWQEWNFEFYVRVVREGKTPDEARGELRFWDQATLKQMLFRVAVSAAG